MMSPQSLAQGWLEDWSEPERKPRTFSRELNRKCSGSPKEAEEAWLVIVEISNYDLSPMQRAMLAASPLEKLLSYHGDAFIERVESHARMETKFKLILQGVWQLFMSDEVWERVRAARSQS